MTDKVMPPTNIGAEQALLGACLIRPVAVDEVADIVAAEDFYRTAHSLIFTAILAVRDGGTAVDPVSVLAELERTGALVQAGGGPYLHTLMETVPTAINAAYYAETVAAIAVRRRLLEAGQRAIQLADTPGDIGEILERARSAFDGVAEQVRTGGDASVIGDLAESALLRYATPATAGLSTPWADLTAQFNGGLRPGTLTVVGARPGQGKSIFGSNLCVHTAQHGLGALFISLEMPEAEVTDRAVSSLSAVTYSRILRHDLEDDHWGRVQVAVDKLSGIPLRIVDKPYLTLTAIRSLARNAAKTIEGLALLVVDYIQLMAPADSRVPREQQVAAMSRGLKLLAKELMVPVVALAQLNRAGAGRADKTPTLTDLRESGQLEADADHVLLLHLPDEEARMGELDVYVAKNRGGPTGKTTLMWAPHCQSIRGFAREDVGWTA